MKPRFHCRISPFQVRSILPVPGGKVRKSSPIRSLAVLGLMGMTVPSVFAIDYTIVPGATTLDWNTDLNWTPFTLAQYPGTAVGDNALITGNFANVAQVVDLSAVPLNALTGITLGDTNATPVATTVQTSNASSIPLNAATITSGGTAGAVNTISAPILLTGGLTFGASSTNNLLVSGKITPSAAAARTLNNSSGKTVTFGDIDISTGAATAVLTFRNENNFGTNRINLNGVIADGGSVSGGLIFDGRFNGPTANIFEIGNNSVLNTYSGTTILQSNGAGGRTATFLINSDQPFGTGLGTVSPAVSGKLTVGQASNSVTIIEALNSARVIGSPIVDMARKNTFQGAHGITFSGLITTGSSHELTNNLSGSAQLKFDGRYNLDNSANTTLLPISGTSDSRLRTFAGTGVTIFNGIIADHANPTADMFGGINLSGAGSIIINGTATFQGGCRITGDGTIQLGNGGTTGTYAPDFPTLSYDDYSIVLGAPTLSDPLNYPSFVKKGVVTGGTTGTGAFAVKRSDDLVLSQTINGGIGLKQVGSGLLTVSTRQFNSGANQVGDGITPSKLVVTATATAESTQTGDFGAPEVHGGGYNAFYQIITNLEDTSLLEIGQPVYLGSANAAHYIHSIDSSTQVTLIGTGITNAASGLIPGQNASGPVVDQTIKFGAGSSLGTSTATTTVKALSTLAGTGTISGAVNVEGILEPGTSIGTLSTGPLGFSSGSTLKVEINTTDLTSDKVVVTGNVTASGSPTLDLTDLGADVALPNGTKFVLIDYSGTYASAGVLTYLGNPVPDFSSITKGANTYHVNYADPTEGGTALTLTVGPAPAPTTAYEAWIESFSSQLPTFSYGPGDNPDNDGRDNLLEFALNGNPGSGSNEGKMVVSTDDSGDVDTDRELTVTLAVRNGAVFAAGPGGSSTATIDGMVYTIQGSQALQTWNSAISEVTPASTLVPAPDTGWSARTFKVNDSTNLPDKRFIRVGVE